MRLPLLLLLPALAAAAALPTLSDEIAKCKVNSTRYGTCPFEPSVRFCAARERAAWACRRAMDTDAYLVGFV